MPFAASFGTVGSALRVSAVRLAEQLRGRGTLDGQVAAAGGEERQVVALGEAEPDDPGQVDRVVAGVERLLHGALQVRDGRVEDGEAAGGERIAGAAEGRARERGRGAGGAVREAPALLGEDGHGE